MQSPFPGACPNAVAEFDRSQLPGEFRERDFVFMAKKCRGCGELKDESKFYSKDKTGRLFPDCKECHIDRLKISYRLNPQKAIQAQLDYYYKNREQRIQKAKDYQQRNKCKTEAYKRAYRKAHPEINAVDHAKRRQRENTAEGDFTGEQWRLLCVRYNYTCLRCGTKAEDTPQGTLTVDHVRPLSKGGFDQKGKTMLTPS